MILRGTLAIGLTLYQPSVAFYIETSHLIYILCLRGCSSVTLLSSTLANQMTDFYMKCNTRLKWVIFISVSFVKDALQGLRQFLGTESPFKAK